MTIELLIIAITVAFGFGILAMMTWHSFKNKKPDPNNPLDGNPAIMIIETLMLALNLCQNTLIRIRKASGQSAIENVAELFFDEIYTYIMMNQSDFDPVAVSYIQRIDRRMLSKIYAKTIIEFVKSVDRLIIASEKKLE